MRPQPQLRGHVRQNRPQDVGGGEEIRQLLSLQPGHAQEAVAIMNVVDVPVIRHPMQDDGIRAGGELAGQFKVEEVLGL